MTLAKIALLARDSAEAMKYLDEPSMAAFSALAAFAAMIDSHGSAEPWTTNWHASARPQGTEPLRPQMDIR
jgi:hypothetical protein